MVDLAAVDTRSPELERLSMGRVASLMEAWKVKQSRDYPDPLDIGDPKDTQRRKYGNFSAKHPCATARSPGPYTENLDSHLSRSTRFAR